jgi:hypothetical protein
MPRAHIRRIARLVLNLAKTDRIRANFLSSLRAALTVEEGSTSISTATCPLAL